MSLPYSTASLNKMTDGPPELQNILDVPQCSGSQLTLRLTLHGAKYSLTKEFIYFLISFPINLSFLCLGFCFVSEIGPHLAQASLKLS